jgi:hypothetical protein
MPLVPDSPWNNLLGRASDLKLPAVKVAPRLLEENPYHSGWRPPDGAVFYGQLAVSFDLQRCGKPSPITAWPCFRSAAMIAACRLFCCLRVAAGALPASNALQISSAVIGRIGKMSTKEIVVAQRVGDCNTGS